MMVDVVVALFKWGVSGFSVSRTSCSARCAFAPASVEKREIDKFAFVHVFKHSRVQALRIHASVLYTSARRGVFARTDGQSVGF